MIGPRCLLYFETYGDNILHLDWTFGLIKPYGVRKNFPVLLEVCLHGHLYHVVRLRNFSPEILDKIQIG